MFRGNTVCADPLAAGKAPAPFAPVGRAGSEEGSCAGEGDCLPLDGDRFQGPAADRCHRSLNVAYKDYQTIDQEGTVMASGLPFCYLIIGG